MAAQLTQEQRILHFLNRTSFGATPRTVERASRIGIRAYLDEQLAPQAIADNVVDEKVAGLKTMRMSSRELYRALSARQRRQGARHGDRPDERAARGHF